MDSTARSAQYMGCSASNTRRTPRSCAYGHQVGDAIRDPVPGSDDVPVAGGQPADHHDQLTGTKGRGLVDRGPVVQQRFSGLRRVAGGEKAAAAEAGHPQAGIANQPGGALGADLGNPAPPHPQRGDPGPHSAFDGLRQGPVPGGAGVQRQPVQARIADFQRIGVRHGRACQPLTGEQFAEPPHREVGVGEQAGPVGEPEGLHQVRQRAAALQSADHGEPALDARSARTGTRSRSCSTASARRRCAGRDPWWSPGSAGPGRGHRRPGPAARSTRPGRSPRRCPAGHRNGAARRRGSVPGS